jgi:hypothetical protein
VHPPGRIHDQQLALAAFLAGADGVKDDRAGVGARALGDDLNPRPLAPDLELVDCGRAKCIGGGQYDLLASPLIILGQFGDAGRLARSVDADDQDDG